MEDQSITSHRSLISHDKWIVSPRDFGLSVPFVRVKPLRPLGNDQMEYQINTGSKAVIIAKRRQEAFEVSNGQLYDDMCQMSILNEPQVLYNLVKRYEKDLIYTYIGPTLIAVNPYKELPQFFSKQAMVKIRQAITQDKMDKIAPHVYMVAGKAYKSMLVSHPKQSIVISGQSGAGKTQSTKYCMQLLTSLSHLQAHAIQGKILACNPLLQAFGNSKTIRNDNSSRFGKYVQIFFGTDNTIKGATINSYLLEKSRVVSLMKDERSFHIFYALTSSRIQGLKQASQYHYLSQSKCYTASNHNDQKYFLEVSRSMDQIGFKKQQKQKIWKLLAAILMLGNIQFNDSDHRSNESIPCKIQNRDVLKEISEKIGLNVDQLEKILVFQKKKFLKEFTMSPYNKDSCKGNLNTFSKAIYNAIFEFILYKVQISLRPAQNKDYKSISILDIFGFQNFLENSFEQLCINFANQKLLKLYNRYIFQRQMEILKQDGLSRQINDIKPPTNDLIIDIISGKLSLFSIINDMTNPQQFKDQDMSSGFKNKLKSQFIKFDNHNQKKFIIKHSQCDVIYSVDGFKYKNQDKIKIQIQQIVIGLFENQSKDNFGKTLLDKFQKGINQLMAQLQSSNTNFIRCIKPNQKKICNYIQQHYVLSQIRYLGVFQTIQIRKKTFPSRKLYDDFAKLYGILYPNIKGKSSKDQTLHILQKLTQNKKDYLFGIKRVYVTNQIQNLLNTMLYKLLKLKNSKALLIQKAFKKYKSRKNIKNKLKILVKRIQIWKKISTKNTLEIKKQYYQKIYLFTKNKKDKQNQEYKNKLQSHKNKVGKEKIEKNKTKINEKMKILEKIIKKSICYQTFKKIKLAANRIDQTIIVEDQNQPNYVRANKRVNQVQTSFVMNQTFINQQSMYVPNQTDSVFKKNLTVDFYQEGDNPKLQKLQLILAQKYKLEITQNQQDFFSPNSQDCNFKVQQTNNQALQRILSFSSQQFFKRVLRKRTNFIGIRRNQQEILTAKPRPMSKSLTILPQSDEQQALKIFRILVKIGQQAKLENVFKLIENMIELCKGTTQQLKNQVFLMLIKQSNTPSQLASIRIFQCIAVFLHIYAPDNQFLYAALNIFYQKLGEQKLTQKQQQYIRYLFKKILRIIQRPFSINYMPIKYQIMALMCKRQISIPVYLPIGNSVLIRVQSYHTFGDIKVQVMQQFGLNHKRLNPSYFTFFQIVNFQNQQLGQSPIIQNQIVWDVMTYWQKAKDKYKQTQIIPPTFFLMLKVRYAYQCFPDDIQTIELFFAQCYFDYFIGRIKLPRDSMAILAACIKIIKLSHKPIDQITGAYPIWVIKQNQKQVLQQLMKNNIIKMKNQGLNQIAIKYKFLVVCDQCPLSLALAIPTQQPIKLFLKPKMIYLTQKCNVLQSFSIRSVVKWAIDRQKFIFDVKGTQGKSRSQAIFTQHANICSSYLSMIPKLISNGQQNNNKFLKHL